MALLRLSPPQLPLSNHGTEFLLAGATGGASGSVHLLAQHDKNHIGPEMIPPLVDLSVTEAMQSNGSNATRVVLSDPRGQHDGNENRQKGGLFL